MREESASANYWDSYVRKHLCSGRLQNREEWLSHPLVQEQYWRLYGGLGPADWLFKEAMDGRPANRGAGLGCGTAEFELHLLEQGAIKYLDLYDLSPASLEVAFRRVSEFGMQQHVRCHLIDLNQIELHSASYDLVICRSSLHHVSRLEHVLAQARNALTQGGLLYFSEYVGPSRFAFPEGDLLLPRLLYRSISSELKGPNPELPVPNPEEVAQADPSESVRSADILGLVNVNFSRLTLMERGGAVPFMMWFGLNHDSLYETATGFELVSLLLYLDRMLRAAQRIPNYFVDGVAWP